MYHFQHKSRHSPDIYDIFATRNRINDTNETQTNNHSFVPVVHDHTGRGADGKDIYIRFRTP